MNNKRKLPTCPCCSKGLFDCLVILGEDKKNYHLECLEIKKEKEANPVLFSRLEQLEQEVRKMKGKENLSNKKILFSSK